MYMSHTLCGVRRATICAVGMRDFHPLCGHSALNIKPWPLSLRPEEKDAVDTMRLVFSVHAVVAVHLVDTVHPEVKSHSVGIVKINAEAICWGGFWGRLASPWPFRGIVSPICHFGVRADIVCGPRVAQPTTVRTNKKTAFWRYV